MEYRGRLTKPNHPLYRLVTEFLYHEEKTDQGSKSILALAFQPTLEYPAVSVKLMFDTAYPDAKKAVIGKNDEVHARLDGDAADEFVKQLYEYNKENNRSR